MTGNSSNGPLDWKNYEQEPDVLMHGAGVLSALSVYYVFLTNFVTGDTADIKTEKKAKGKGKARDDILDSDTDTVIPAHRRPNAAPSNSNFGMGTVTPSAWTVAMAAAGKGQRGVFGAITSFFVRSLERMWVCLVLYVLFSA